ncbi:DEAD/DEAH box helicase [Mesorhizobium sp. LNHC229A00]|uniref:DEAD/DEAH box helicase n=1 Tax=Mesorhizobium sp. LNHC229A00 TaxID=1287240 RepID=UPI0003CE8334|nr:DEAD/DEAH box helicase [Mesorhizobium sp. LNHC229A00]ESY94893.1 DEAD/DEAH box helicase [Mesorhizobium sp. LNHC229A00]
MSDTGAWGKGDQGWRGYLVFDPQRGYAGASPGQNLESLLGRLTVRDLQIIVGPRVLPLLPSQPKGDRSALLAAAERALQDRAQNAVSNTEIRKTLLRNLDLGKLEELKARLAQGGVDVADDALDISDLGALRPWAIASGFFGLQGEETAAGTTALSRQEIQPSFSLFAHQRSVVRRAYSRVGSGYGRTLIHMPTGSGKTRTAMHLVSRALNEFEPGVVVWLATSRELLEQAAETFEAAWASLGNRDLEIRRFWGAGTPAPEDMADGILVAGLAKLHAWRERDGLAFLKLAAKVRLVIMDEAHQAVAPTYREVIEGLCGAGGEGALLGLTATPGRSWNDMSADEALSEFFGGSKVVLEIGDDPNPVKYLLDNGYLSRPAFHQIEYSPAIRPTPAELKKLAKLDDYAEETLNKLAADTARNLAILDAAKGLIARGHARIILFAVSVEHAQDMASALSAYGILSAVVSGDTPSPKRTSILKTFKGGTLRPQILCNFGVLTTGFDAPRTSAAIIARPTKSLVLYSQMVGRATRGPRAGGNETCEILTVHDPAYPGFGDIAEAFFNWEDVWHGD